MDSLYLQAARSVILSSVIDIIWISLNFLNSWISTRFVMLTPSNIKGLFIWSQYAGISRLPETYFNPGLYDIDTPACPRWPGCVYSVNKIVEKLLIICRSKENKFWSHINSIPKNVVSFCFLIWRFCLVSANVLNFSSLHPRVPGYCVCMEKHLSRLTRISIASTKEQVRLDVPVSI